MKNIKAHILFETIREQELSIELAMECIKKRGYVIYSAYRSIVHPHGCYVELGSFTDEGINNVRAWLNTFPQFNPKWFIVENLEEKNV